MLRKANRYAFTDTLLTFPKLLEQFDEQLFLRVVRDNHCLYDLLEKDNAVLQMSLRPRCHSLNVFISRTLPRNISFSEIYITISDYYCSETCF